MAGNYDPLRDVALTIAAVIHSVVTNTTLDVDALMRMTGRLGINHGTDPAEIEDKLRGTIERRVRRHAAREILFLHEVDAGCTRTAGPYGSMDVSLRKLSRGEPLPDWRELRGGQGAELGEAENESAHSAATREDRGS